MIEKFIVWYLNRKALQECGKQIMCSQCRYGTNDCYCLANVASQTIGRSKDR